MLKEKQVFNVTFMSGCINILMNLTVVSMLTSLLSFFIEDIFIQVFSKSENIYFILTVLVCYLFNLLIREIIFRPKIEFINNKIYSTLSFKRIVIDLDRKVKIKKETHWGVRSILIESGNQHIRILNYRFSRSIREILGALGEEVNEN